MRLSFILALPLLLAAAGGAEAAADADGLDCNNAVTQMDMNFCADKDFHSADKKLNAVYRVVKAKEDAHGQELLTAAEKAWVAWRDAQCIYDTKEEEGGSIRPMEYSNCQTDMTNARIKELGGK